MRDLLFIGTIHAYGLLRRELAAHHGATNRYIVLQTTEIDALEGEAGQVPKRGLQPAVDDFVEAHHEWTVELRDRHNNGLTVLARLGASPGALATASPLLGTPTLLGAPMLRVALCFFGVIPRSIKRTCPTFASTFCCHCFASKAGA